MPNKQCNFQFSIRNNFWQACLNWHLIHAHHLVPSARIYLTISRHPLHRSLLPAGPLGYISYPHRTAVCMCKLVSLTLLGYGKESMGVHHLWARPYSPTLSCMLCSSNFDSFRDGWLGGAYSCRFVGCFLQYLFNIARNILV